MSAICLEARRFHVRAWVAVLSLAACAVASGDERLERLIERLRVEEARYANYEITVFEEHSASADDNTHVAALPDGGVVQFTFNTTQNRRRKIHSIRQNQFFRVEVTGLARHSDDLEKPIDDWQCYAGSDTYSQSSGQGHRFQGRREESHSFSPHTWMHQDRDPSPSLSQLLDGKVAGFPFMGGGRVSSEYVEKASLDGAQTHRIRVRFTPDGEKEWRWQEEFWLSEERNLLPVRWRHYSAWNRDIPLTETDFTDFGEVLPGVWFPRNRQSRHFDPFILAQDKSQRLLWGDVAHVLNISLQPNHPVDFFRSLNFPVGMPVSDERLPMNSRIGEPVQPLVEK